VSYPIPVVEPKQWNYEEDSLPRIQACDSGDTE